MTQCSCSQCLSVPFIPIPNMVLNQAISWTDIKKYFISINFKLSYNLHVNLIVKSASNFMSRERRESRRSQTKIVESQKSASRENKNPTNLTNIGEEERIFSLSHHRTGLKFIFRIMKYLKLPTYQLWQIKNQIMKIIIIIIIIREKSDYENPYFFSTININVGVSVKIYSTYVQIKNNFSSHQ